VVAGKRIGGILVYQQFTIIPQRLNYPQATSQLLNIISTTGPRQFKYPSILIKKVGAKSVTIAIFDE